MRRKRERVHGAEVTSDAAQLIAEGVVEKDRLELALLAHASTGMASAQVLVARYR